MGVSRLVLLFPHRRCMPCYPLDNYPKISKYYFKLFNVSFLFLYQLKVRIVDIIVAFRKLFPVCWRLIMPYQYEHNNTTLLKAYFFWRQSDTSSIGNQLYSMGHHRVYFSVCDSTQTFFILGEI